MININNFRQFESMIHKKSLDQMRAVSDIMGNNNIGIRVSDDSFSNSLKSTKRDVFKSNIQSYGEFMNEPFTINQNRLPMNKQKLKRKKK